MKHFNSIIKILVFLSSINPIFTRIITEVTDHGITLLRGSSDELQDVRDSIAKLLEDKDNHINRQKRSVDSGLGNLSLKELIAHQIAMNIDKQFRVRFPEGALPGRGIYKSSEVDEALTRTGLKKDAEEYGVLPLPRSHYCRYRVPTEVNGDDTNCCRGENKQCYTEAGCFCDESCYTKYGDCCTDHFVKCYQFLKLCLIAVDDEAAKKQDDLTEDEYNNQGNHKVSAINRDSYNEIADMQDLLTMRAFGGTFLTHKPTQLTPDQCCGQKPYNSGDEDEQQRNPLCCDQNLHWVNPGTTCDEYENAK